MREPNVNPVRTAIVEQIQDKENLVEKLRSEIEDLEKEYLLLSDEYQQYTEATETYSRRVNSKKVTTDYLIGRINWVEKFKDEDTEEVISIERTRVVRIDGE